MNSEKINDDISVRVPNYYVVMVLAEPPPNGAPCKFWLKITNQPLDM